MSLMIYLVRHGQTEFNLHGRIQGWSDSPLTEVGRKSLADTGGRLKNVQFDAAFCSTAPRAIDSARIILNRTGQPHVPLAALDELREYHFGSFEGGSIETLYQRIARESGYPNTAEWLNAYRRADFHMLAESVSKLDPEHRAENEAAFLSRLHRGLFKVLSASPSDGNILVVSHGMAITALLKEIQPDATLYQSVPNASVTRLIYSVFRGLSIISIADAEAGRIPHYDIVGSNPDQTAKALAKRRNPT